MIGSRLSAEIKNKLLIIQINLNTYYLRVYVFFELISESILIRDNLFYLLYLYSKKNFFNVLYYSESI